MPKSPWRTALASIVAAALVLGVVVETAPAGADEPVTRTWVGPAGGLWSTPGNWSPAGAPGAGDIVLFDPGVAEEARSVVDYAASVASVETAASAKRDTYIDNTAEGSISVAGGFVARSLKLVVEVPVVLSAGQHTVGTVAPGEVSFRDGMSGPGGVTTTGTGRVEWTAPSDFDGPAVLSASLHTLQGGGSLGSLAAGTTVTDGASIQFVGIPSQTFTEPLTLVGSGNARGDATLLLAFDPIVSGPIELVGDVRVTGNDGELSGPISGTGALRVFTSEITLSGAGSTYSGGTRVDTRMTVTASGALGSGPVVIARHSLTLDGDVELANSILLDTASAVLRALNGDARLSGALTLESDWDSGNDMAIEIGPEASLTLLGGLHGTVGGNGGVNKVGPGLLVIEGAQPSTFAGPVRISNGALVAAAVPGSAAVPRNLYVHDGAALVTLAPDQLRNAWVELSPAGVLDLMGNDQSMARLSGSGAVFLGYTDEGVVDTAVLTAGEIFLPEGAVGMVLAPNEADRVVVSGNAMIDGAYLDVTLAGEVPVGREHILVKAGTVSGSFGNLLDGFNVVFQDRAFRARYGAGDGNDISLLRIDPFAPLPAPPPPPAPQPLPSSGRSGYWMVAADGTVYPFGGATWLGNPRFGTTPAQDLEPSPSGQGYWVVDASGRVFAFGDAPSLGGLENLGGSEKVTSISATPSGRGYWLFTTAGRVVPFGDAIFFGDMSRTTLNGPVLDSVPTPSGRGYYMVASDGGIFAFGDAVFAGSMGGKRLNAPVQSLVPDGDGRGYWLVASDGGIFAFEAPFYGSMGASKLNRPITGMVASGSTGYLMVGEDGGIFAFGSAPFHGSLGDRPPASPITSVAVLR